jgi:predicted ATPase/DNA-binding CsgD family transcriptional regulator
MTTRARQSGLLDSLTDRELEILRLIDEGLSNAEIANRLFLSLDTIKWYTKQLYSKLGVNSRTQAVLRARELHLLEPMPSFSQPIPKHNLPAQPNQFIGREREVSAVKQLLAANRLVTLTGTGGTGKTRLSLQVAVELVDAFEDGVCFVPLSAVTDPKLVLPAIANALDVDEVAGRTLLNGVKQTLRSKTLLLVIDNFEHVIAAAPLISDFLQAVPRLKVLVTSREVLHLYGEQEYRVPPLALPNVTCHEAPVILLQYEAVALFLQRAQGVKPDFDLSEENAPAVVEICVRLDGLPLAIELAAARTKLFAPQALLARLDKRLHLLTGGAQDVPARQRTLRSTIDWSYNLLEESEKWLFARLAVFSGGWTAEAAEAVCGGGLALDVLTGLVSLLDKSLLRQSEDMDGEPRFFMLETIREYAAEKLAESDEEAAVRCVHVDYFLALAERAEPELYTANQLDWLDRLEAEHDNLRAAFAWCATHHSMIERELRLVGALKWFWYLHTHFHEARDLGESALARDTGVPHRVRIRALNSAGLASFCLQDVLRADPLQREALQLAHQANDPLLLALALWHMGVQYEGKVEGLRFSEEALAISRRIGDPWLTCGSLVTFGVDLFIQGKYGAAKAAHDEGVVLARQLGDRSTLSYHLSHRGRIAFLEGDLETQARLLPEGLNAARELQDKRVIIMILCALSENALWKGEYGSATSFIDEALTLSRNVGNPGQIQDAVGLKGDIEQAKGNFVEAASFYRESLDIIRMGLAVGEYDAAAEQFGRLAAAQGQAARAACLLSAAETLPRLSDIVVPPPYQARHERALATARALLTEAEFEAACAAGRAMSVEQMIAYVLQEDGY